MQTRYSLEGSGDVSEVVDGGEIVAAYVILLVRVVVIQMIEVVEVVEVVEMMALIEVMLFVSVAGLLVRWHVVAGTEVSGVKVAVRVCALVDPFCYLLCILEISGEGGERGEGGEGVSECYIPVPLLSVRLVFK